METSEQLDKIAPALVAALAEIENAAKDAKNPHFRSSYATLASVIDATKVGLTKHGLTVLQTPGWTNGVVSVTTRILHTSGQWVQGTAGAPAAHAWEKVDGKLTDKGPTAQTVGSAITYLRRYSLAAVCGITQEDDDGNAASNTKAPAKIIKLPEPTEREWTVLKADLLQIDASGLDPAPDTAKAHAVVDARNAALYSRVRSYASDLLR
jgi:hypothetical protein